MGISLQDEIEPLLAKLDGLAHDAFDHLSNTGYSAAREQLALKTLNSDLASLKEKFRGYYSLDGHDNLSALADEFAVKSDRGGSPSGNSVYHAITQAAAGIDYYLADMSKEKEWEGTGADSFRDNFLTPFRSAAQAHVWAATEMAIATQALAVAVESYKACVVWICRELIYLLDGGTDPGSFPGEEKLNIGDLEDGANIAGILLGVVSLFMALTEPEISVPGAAVDAIGTALGLFQEAKSASSSSKHVYYPQIAGHSRNDNVFAIVQLSYASLVDLDSHMADIDEQIYRGLNADRGDHGCFDSPLASFRNPSLPSIKSYSKLTVAKGYDDAADPIVVTVTELYYCGFEILPSAAEGYNYGVKVCEEANIAEGRTGGLQRQFPRAVPEFDKAAADFKKLLAATRDDLTKAGQVMVQAAKTYRYADEYEAQQIKLQEDQISSLPRNPLMQEHYIPPWLQ